MKAYRRVSVALAALAGAVMVFGASAGSALAAGGYGAVAGQQSGGGSGSSLPFTGADLAGYILVAVAIIAAGVALRTVAGRSSRV